MTLGGLFTLGAALWAAWVGYGLWRWRAARDQALLSSVLVGVPAALLIRHTLAESGMWSHLPVPYTLLLWPLLWLLCLIAAMVLRRERPAMWPVLGLPATGLPTALLASFASV
ncbi:hypothetical protein [Deinococcus multiflagellatus]|uniref:Uncharacterized protein n=1 Tax=Deinococcus multiflagellatus TaxID=1656887 RepID=A0ABW1ZGB4_9DEIO|nr:hypothetical protein [Deinococcus multiflagellatus]MBZ9712871.1 hypothetical protein [Deinococcus multiflagellatus]